MVPAFLRRFSRNDSGNVATIFAVAAVPLMLLIGAAVDYSRSAAASAKLQADVDATTLAMCKSTVTSVSTLKTNAATMMGAYETNYPVTIDALTVSPTPRTVNLTAHISFPTTFMRLANINSLDVRATAACSAGETYYEIALVLDTTGSMAASSGGVSKIQALQNAATNFVNTMFSSIDAAHLKISLVPFAASVKVDPATYANASWLDLNGRSSLHWQNVTYQPGNYGFASRFDIFRKLATSNPNWAWAGCLQSLPYPLNVQDTASTSTNPDSLFVPLFAPDEVGNYASSSSSANSYLDDGTSGSPPCDNSTTDIKRLGQACKYANPTRIRTDKAGPNWMCDARPLTRLTNSRSTLLSEISRLTAAGNTDIHEGFMWGWRTISPNSVFADGAAYTSPSPTTNIVKIIVVMTDGTNTWTASGTPVTGSYYSAYGYFKNADGKPNAHLPSANANPNSSSTARAAIDALTAQACTNAKTAGVTVYSVGFSVPSDPIDSAGQSLLSNCASQTANYFLASDSTALNNAFSSIAQGIGQLRLTH